MEPITQGALGASFAEHKREKLSAWLAGALAGMVAALDRLIYSPQNRIKLYLPGN